MGKNKSKNPCFFGSEFAANQSIGHLLEAHLISAPSPCYGEASSNSCSISKDPHGSTLGLGNVHAVCHRAGRGPQRQDGAAGGFLGMGVPMACIVSEMVYNG